MKMYFLSLFLVWGRFSRFNIQRRPMHTLIILSKVALFVVGFFLLRGRYHYGDSIVKVRCVLSCYLLLEHLSCTFSWALLLCCRPSNHYAHYRPYRNFPLQHTMTEHKATNNFSSEVLFFMAFSFFRNFFFFFFRFSSCSVGV